MSAANWGRAQILGVVDTGIVAANPVFASGQVSQSLSACAAVSFRCTNGVVDDNGHGTAVAAIAAGNKTFAWASNYGGYAVTANSVVSVAPNANIIAEKVLNASGSGYSTDVANGVRKAADAGASVINVSITYGNTADVVSAINYAASKGSFIVWAGGNSSVNLLNGANTNGLTAQAISRLVFAGSVNAANVVSSFSNKPGSGALALASGAKTSYASRWVMAPGEAILAPYATAGSGAWAYWSGTSMAAPVVSGSMLLLQSSWPILKTNGTTANLLLATASDLGTKGVDATYGNGLVNLATAFQPYGALSVTQSNGKTVAVTSLTGSMISSGALGSLSAVQAKLANYTALDTYQRNFTVNLSGLIKSPAAKASLNPLPTNINTGVRAIKLSDGAELSYWQGAASNRIDHQGEFGYNENSQTDRRQTYAMVNDSQGRTSAFGYGAPVNYSFSRALLGDEALARLSGETEVLGLNSLAQGGGMAVLGVPLGNDVRVAVAWNSTASVVPGSSSDWTPAWSRAEASGLSMGLSYRLNPRLTAGVSVGTLNEKHGLLGLAYDANSNVNLGDHNRSMSYGLSLGYRVDADRSLLLEAGLANTRAATADGMFAGTTGLQSRSWGISYLQQNLWQRNDRLTLSLKQPLRVMSGQIGMVNTSIDDAGVAHYTTEWVGLAPDGREIDYKLAYALPLGKRSELAFQTSYRKDVLNVKGSNDAAIGATWSRRF